MKEKNKRGFIFLAMLLIALVSFTATTSFSEVINESEIDEPIFEEEKIDILSRDLSNEPMYYQILINDKSIQLTENEYETLLPVMDEFISVEEIQEYLIKTNAVDNNQLINALASRASFTSSHYFNWNNWQNNTPVRIVTNNDIKPRKLGGTRWEANVATTVYVDGVRDSVPATAIKRHGVHVANATSISKPQWDIKFNKGISRGYYDFGRKRIAPLNNTILGQAEYEITPVNNVNRRMINMYLPDKVGINFQPNEESEISINATIRYNTPALNGINNQDRQPVYLVNYGIHHPQVVKTVHVDKTTGKVLQGVRNFGLKGFLQDPIKTSKLNFAGYNYDSFEVYVDGIPDQSSSAESWSGKLNKNKRGIVFFYTPKPKKYTVQFQTNGGTRVANQTVEHGKTSRKPTNPTYAGKNFEGWYADSTLKTPFNFNQEITKNTTVYAKWSNKKYTVNFVTNGGTNVGSQTVEHGKTSRKPTNPTYTGKNFEGWYADSGFKTAFNFNQGVTKNTTVYAKWSPKKYNVKFETNGGTNVGSQTVEHGKTSRKPSNPTYTGKNFEGWYADSGLKTPFNFNQGITKDTTVYAKWSDKKYAVRFETNGGTNVGSQTVQHGKTSTEPVPPTYGDKGFEGWYADSKFETVFDFTKPITRDTVVYAKWRIQKYTVRFETNGGSKVDYQSVEEGKKSTKPTDPTYPAKEFKGWYKTNEFIDEFDFDQPITEDITLYAKWRSKILDPKDGKTPVTPIEGDKEKPQNNTSKELRIQYVSDFDFGKVKNSSFSSQELSDGDSVLTDQNEKKEVPSFISIIDDRPKNKGSWSLYSKATSFVSQTGHEMMGAELILKDMNYAKGMSKVPSIEGDAINLSTADPQLITKSSNETSNGSWSLAFGSLNSNSKSTGAVLNIPKNTVKANTDYHSVIEWTLVPEI